ncbi:hypothetical protein Tco_0796183 [Tanacetum coccineum]
MIVYLKNMAGYKMNYFKGMSYDEIRPIFNKEYSKVQTLFKKDSDVEKTKTKRVAKETLLQESFKKLRSAKASRLESIQEQPTEEPKDLSEEDLQNMVGNITEAYQVFEDMLKGFDKEDLVTLRSLVKERFSSAEPTEDMEKSFMGGHTLRSDEGSKKLNELTVLCTKFSDKVTSLEEDLKQTKKVYGNALNKLVKKELILEDTSKQRRKIDEIDQDPFISLVQDEGMKFVHETEAETQENISSGDIEVIKGSGDTEVLDIEKETSIAHIPVSTASASETISTAAPRTPPTTTKVFDDEDISMAMAQTLIKRKEEVAQKLHVKR